MPKLTALLTLTFLALTLPAFSQTTPTWEIRETRSDKPPKIVSYQWKAPEQNGLPILTCTQENREQVLRVNSKGETQSWETGEPEQSPSLIIQRTSGGFLAQKGNEKIKLDDPGYPWIQNMALLGNFVLSPDKELVFQAFTESMGKELKAKGMTVMKASKTAKETLQLQGIMTETAKVHVTFNDYRSAFWGADYWFRAKDGLLVQYKETRGGPGTPETKGVLVRESLP